MNRQINQQEIWERACNGDSAAQYAVAVLLTQANRPGEAQPWLEKAATAGHAEALYTWATIDLQKGEMHLEQGIKRLKKASKKGSLSARRLSALLHFIGLGFKQNDHEAFALLSQAALSGYPPAVRELAVLLLLTSAEEQAEAEKIAASLLRLAARKGDWIAAFICVREALRGRFFLSTEECQNLATRLRGGGTPLSESYSDDAMSALPVRPAMNGKQPEADQVLALLDAGTMVGSSVQKTSLHKKPDINSASHALTPLACDYLIAQSAGLMIPSRVVNSSTSAQEQYRSSDGAVLQPVDQDLISAMIVRRLAKIAGVPYENSEFLSLLRYQPGQEYKPHYDYLSEDKEDYSKIRQSGQRKITVLTYLNGGYAGGETAFPKLDIRFKGQTGDSLLFQNTDDNMMPLENSLHAGLSVTSGVKWLATLWLREKPFWPWRL